MNRINVTKNRVLKITLITTWASTACSAGQLASSSKKCANGPAANALMLNSAPATTVGATSAGNSANNSTAPETLGGVIEIDAIAPAPGQADSISQNRFESLSFGKRR